MFIKQNYSKRGAENSAQEYIVKSQTRCSYYAREILDPYQLYHYHARSEAKTAFHIHTYKSANSAILSYKYNRAGGIKAIPLSDERCSAFMNSCAYLRDRRRIYKPFGLK